LLCLSLGLLSLLAWPFPAGPRFVPVALGLMAPAAAMLMIRPFILPPPSGCCWLLPCCCFRYEDERVWRRCRRRCVTGCSCWWPLLLLLHGHLDAGRGAGGLLLPGARLLLLALGIMLAGFPFFHLGATAGNGRAPAGAARFAGLLPLLALVLAVQLMAAYPALARPMPFWSGCPGAPA
jgi:hypothetical protein